MPKYSTCPTLFDECKTISVSDLRRWNYLPPDNYMCGTITWSRNGEKTGSISITVNSLNEDPFLYFDYKCNDKPISYKVRLISIPSNLGKGSVWYFICPHTGKRCRKLYLVGGYFFHRSAFKDCYYEKQTYSYKTRNLIKIYEMAFGDEKAYSELYKKNFKKYYSGRPTKRYLRIYEKIQRSEQFTTEQKSRLLLP